MDLASYIFSKVMKNEHKGLDFKKTILDLQGLGYYVTPVPPTKREIT